MEAYQYRVLPFSLALSPRTYTKCMDAALAPLRLQGIRILNYRNDWMILDTVSRASTLRCQPSSENNISGGCMGFDHDAGTAVSCTCRIHSKSPNNIKLGQRITVHYLQRVLGLMAAASTVIPLGLLQMRSFQLWLRARGFHPRARGFIPFLCGSDPGF